MWQTLSNGGPYGEKRPYLSTLPGVGSNPTAPASCPASEGRFQILRHFSKRCVHKNTNPPGIPSVVTAVRSSFPNGRSCEVGVWVLGIPFGTATVGPLFPGRSLPQVELYRGVLGVTNLTSPPYGGFLRFSSSHSFQCRLLGILTFQ